MGIRNITFYYFSTEEIIVADNMHTFVRAVIGSDIRVEIGDVVCCLHGFPE